jgi:O-antigen/teichoic acid export membrane protein
MQRKFITNLALLLFLNLLIKPFWILGVDRSVQNAVGSQEYGIYYALFNFSFLLNILLDFGITNFNNKNIAQNNHLLNKHLSSIIVLRFMLSIAYMLVTLIAGLIIDYNIVQLQILFVLAFNQVLLSLILYLRSNLAGLHLFKTDSFISILDRLIMIMICGSLLWGNITDKKFQIEWYIYGQTVAYALTALITFVIVMDKAKLKKIKWNLAFFLMILKKSYPYAVLVLLMTFYNRIDAVMLERMLPDGARQSGIYASAYRLLDASNMIAFLFASLLLPIFSRMIKQKDSLDEMVKLAFSLLIVPAVIVAAGSFFYRKDLMELLYHENLEEAAKVFGMLMSCFVAISTTYIFGTLLTANGNLKELNLMAASGMLVNIILNYFLIPPYLAVGSAMVSLLTQFLIAISQVLLTQYLFKFRINYRFLFSIFIFVVGVIIINILLKQVFFNWRIGFIFTVISCILWAFIVRLISIRSMYNILLHG